MYFLSDYNYHLPHNLIAQQPITPRDHSRLLVLNKANGQINHDHFYNLPKYLKAGDILVINDTKVFPARLKGYKEDTGGRVEIFLLRPLPNKNWECLIGGKVNRGQKIIFVSNPVASRQSVKNKLIAQIITQQANLGQVKFNQTGAKFWSVLNRFGQTPLPPYIKRAKILALDKNRYQTIYADPKKNNSVAAPTAGLHFTSGLLQKLKLVGIEILKITLHVGLGTFQTIKTKDIREHKMHSEFYDISPAVWQKIKAAKKAGQRIIAVGTTSCRALESAVNSKTAVSDFGFNNRPKLKGQTNIFIYPGYQFKIIDGLITNFHLPQSSLLMLVSALTGKGSIDKAYKIAIAKKYRFFSYGDAMLII